MRVHDLPLPLYVCVCVYMYIKFAWDFVSEPFESKFQSG